MAANEKNTKQNDELDFETKAAIRSYMYRLFVMVAPILAGVFGIIGFICIAQGILLIIGNNLFTILLA